MRQKYHILNGDSLKEQFPKQIKGEIIVTRECLVDGEVNAATLDELFEIRTKFITTSYSSSYSREDYFNNTVSEFQKIQNIPNQSEINLWFEDDLFCQVNFWFVVNLIWNNTQDCNVFLIRPTIHNQYEFGELDTLDLETIYKQKAQITELEKIANLWKSYQNNNTDELTKTAKELELKYPFISKAVKAHIDRIPNEHNLGRPTQTLLNIIKELGTTSFEAIYLEFKKRENIYGFGDLQVRRLLNTIENNH